MKNDAFTKTLRAFTMIELLIVVAIIAILAAVAVPNMLEAHIRSKVARAKSDCRTAALALEAYAVDNNRYPNSIFVRPLTTPVAYVSSDPPDVFAKAGGYPALGYCETSNPDQLLQDHSVAISTGVGRAELASHRYFVFSNGPDLVDDALDQSQRSYDDVVHTPGADLGYFYDATNGTLSRGDITRSAKLRP